MNKVRSALSFLIALSMVVALPAQEKYSKPPKEIEAVLTAPQSPTVSVNPTHDYMMLEQGQRYPSIADLSEPMLRLAGLRINPRTNGPHRDPRIVGLAVKKIGGGEIKVATPPDARLSGVAWSEDGKRFAYTNTTNHGIELWTGVTATGATSKVPGVLLNTACSAGAGGGPGRGGRGGGGGGPVRWINGGKSLLVRTIPAGRGKAPAADAPPEGPNVQQSLTGAKGQVATLEDLLKTQEDEKLYEYYCTAQISVVDPATGKATSIGKPGIYSTVDMSPDGKHLLTARIHRPFSYLYSQQAFPKDVEVWDTTGKVEYKLAKVPLADNLPLESVQTGPRGWEWHPLEPATAIWWEALDGGMTRQPAKERDKIVKLAAPFAASPTEMLRTEQRFGGMQFSESGKYIFIRESDGGRGRNKTSVITDGGKPDVLWTLNSRERYKDPGSMMTKNVHGHSVVIENNGVVLLDGLGSSDQGDHPFLDRFDLKTKKSERIFQSDSESYEQVTTLLDENGNRFITHWETPTDPPNYFIRAANSKGDKQAITKFPDPAPQIRNIKKELVKYKRPDGVDLNFTLYLPPNYVAGTRLPTFIWAYPYEYDDAATAGQVTGSDKRFTFASGRLVLPLAGYAVLDNAAMPIVGDPKTVNDHFIDQITMDAKAAIDKAVEMGVTDRNRVAVGGHSYGAFMTGNLLANTDLFKAGVAESGAYNRTLTPFGFQSERRTYWEASQTYMAMSPFQRADKIKTPLLMFHGEADDNSGTFPIQSERLYQAIRGNGGRVRLVMLPHEAHGYQAKETILHVVFETLTWLDRYVKGDGESTTGSR